MPSPEPSTPGSVIVASALSLNSSPSTRAARNVCTSLVAKLAAVRRGRALVAAHGGARDDAFDNARSAVTLLDGTPLVYERARALLTLGLVARRFKDRGAGRRALSEALDQFERMGAARSPTRSFISTKTVEANLTRIYRRLGVVNRAQLSTRLGGRR